MSNYQQSALTELRHNKLNIAASDWVSVFIIINAAGTMFCDDYVFQTQHFPAPISAVSVFFLTENNCACVEFILIRQFFFYCLDFEPLVDEFTFKSPSTTFILPSNPI